MDARDGVAVDFSVGSVSGVFQWVASRMRLVAKEPDPTLLWWIRKSPPYARSLAGPDDASKLLILRAAYYLGECFVRSSGLLSWATGDPETAKANQPVVRGFARTPELAPILVSENLLMNYLAGRGDIEGTIQAWTERVPTTSGEPK